MTKKARKLNSKATIIYIVFIVFALGIAGGLVYFAMNFGNVDQETYDLANGSTVYDEYDSPVILSTSSYISKSWAGDYVIMNDEDALGTDIGEHTIAVDNNKIVIVGGGYGISEDGSVEQLDEFYEAEITDFQFYKLADRKYLFVAPTINDEDETLNTSGYLYIVMDKQGNAILMNGEIYTKTLIPTVLLSESMNFDIANELLTFNTLEIDMKDVIGTTNEYDPLMYVDANSDYDADSFVNPETIDIEVKAGDGGQGGTGGTGGTGGQGGVGGQGGSGGKGSNAEQSDIVKEIYLLGASATSDSIKVTYYASDPFAQFGLIYIALYDGSLDLSNTSNRMNYIGKHFYNVNTYNTVLNIYDLEPNKTYQVVIGHVTSDDETRNIDDTMKVTTSGVTNSFTVYSQTKSTLGLNIQLDSYYDTYKYGKVIVYYNAATGSGSACVLTKSQLNQKEITFSIADATKSSGVNVTINYDLELIQASENLRFEISVGKESTYEKETTLNFVTNAKNGYYDGTVCGSKFTVTVENGFGETINSTDYTLNSEFTVPGALNPQTLFKSYSLGFGLVFKGWKYSGDEDSNIIHSANEKIKVTSSETLTPVWGCSLDTYHLGDHQCVFWTTVYDGFGNEVKRIEYTPNTTFTAPAEIAPTGNKIDYVGSWGFGFKGWKYSIDEEIYDPGDKITGTADGDLTAVWCPLHSHLGETQCEPDEGYEIDPDADPAAVREK